MLQHFTVNVIYGKSNLSLNSTFKRVLLFIQRTAIVQFVLNVMYAETIFIIMITKFFYFRNWLIKYIFSTPHSSSWTLSLIFLSRENSALELQRRATNKCSIFKLRKLKIYFMFAWINGTPQFRRVTSLVGTTVELIICSHYFSETWQ